MKIKIQIFVCAVPLAIFALHGYALRQKEVRQEISEGRFTSILYSRQGAVFGGKKWDSAQCMIQTRDGGYAVAGYTSSFGAGFFDAWVFKLDDSGNVEWQRTYGGMGYDSAQCIVQTGNGGYAVAGYTSSFGAAGSNFWVLKLDGGGNVEWEKTYGGETTNEYASSIIQTADGGYAVGGHTGGSSPMDRSNACVLKLDGNGNLEWKRTYGRSHHFYGNRSVILQTGDGGYALAGYAFFCRGYNYAWLMKLGRGGDVEWERIFGGKWDDSALCVVQSRDGGYVVAGYTSSLAAGMYDGWIFKLDGNGHLEWERTYGGKGNDIAQCIVQTRDGGFAVAGHTSSSVTQSALFWVLKLDGKGHVEWERTYGKLCFYAYSMVQTTDEGFAVAGAAFTPAFGAGGYDAWILKLDKYGNIPEYSDGMKQKNASAPE